MKWAVHKAGSFTHAHAGHTSVHPNVLVVVPEQLAGNSVLHERSGVQCENDL